MCASSEQARQHFQKGQVSHEYTHQAVERRRPPQRPEATRTTAVPVQHIDHAEANVQRGIAPSDESGAYHTATDLHPTPVVPDQAAIVARQRERFGGIKFGSAFFGWLTATGMAVLLIALLAAAGVAFGVATNTTVDQATKETQDNTGTAQTVGLVGAITLLVVLLLAYYCGGYVAGRMARFNGIRQGLAVWIWGVVMALAIAAIAAIAGTQYDVFAQLNLPRLPVNEGQVTAVGAIASAAAILAALIGALLGGLAGMKFHRKVDKAGLELLDN
jgi:hypothetical protein